MEVISGYSLSKGKKAKESLSRNMSGLYQPLQFLPGDEKDCDWASMNMDFIEYEGILQLKRNVNWMSKNYKLAQGEIEKSDYILAESEYVDIIEPLVSESVSAMELKFYPIIPTIVDVLVNEFSKRVSKITFADKSEQYFNELLDEKYNEVEQVLLAQAAVKQQNKLLQMGLAPDSEEGQQMMSPEKLKDLPQIQNFYNKSYRNIYQEWAEHQKNIDEDRFHMPELEKRAFRDSLVVDREFWHFRMMENDYAVETWNPKQVYYRKSPGTRYISDGMWVGMSTLMTVPEVVDTYGWQMSEEQLKSLEFLFPVKGPLYALDGTRNDGSFYDPTMSHDWNKTGPGLGMRQLMSSYATDPLKGGDVVNWILADSEDFANIHNTSYLVRVSTIYWKTQRRVGHLIKITEDGQLIQDIISEEYKVTDKPLYNTLVYKEKTKNNLMFGEHIDWLWVNEVWGGTKVGPNLPTWRLGNTSDGFAPMYIGYDNGKPGRIPFQFKGDDNLYGCKLPVEGAVFNDYNTRSKSLVDRVKPWQIGFNMVNNQMIDLMVDELGVIVAFDHNALPRHSMGEDWGQGNFQKSVAVMRDFSVLPFDTTIANTENAINQRHFEVLDLTQSQRFMTKIKLSEYFKNEALSSVGLNAQRMGQPIGQEQTATEINQSISASYSQTEQYFSQHSDDLMPRVHQMRTDLAQYYNSTNPSIRLQYATSSDEKVNFLMNGTKLLLREFNVICKTRIDSRNILQQIKQLLLTNNTSGANIYDLIKGIKIEDMSEMDSFTRGIEKRAEKERVEQMAQEQQQHEQQLEAQRQLALEKQQFEADQNELDRQNDVVIAEIRAAFATGTQDINQNETNDYLDSLKFIEGQQQNRDKMDLERQKVLTNTRLKESDQNIQRQKIQAEQERTKQQLQVAKINNKVKEKSKSK